MDFSLRCNSLKCRSQLGDRAVVTTCSHIFCTRCSDVLGLSGAATAERTCPACETQLANNDDAVLTTLNPSEDYKTSVLSGLSPTIILECAGRGLAFYSYQATQEIVYQEYLAKSLTEKYSTLKSQLDNIIYEANSEINKLRENMSAATSNHETLQRAYEKLREEYQRKNRQYQKAEAQYKSVCQQHGINEAARNGQEQSERLVHHASNHPISTNHTTSRAFAPPPGYTNAHPAEQLHPRQRSGGSRNEVSPGTGDSQLHPPRGTQSWIGNAHNTPLRSRLSSHTPQPNRTYPSDHVFQHTPTQQVSHQMRQPLGARDVNIMPQPASLLHGARNGFKDGIPYSQANHIPMNRSRLGHTMAP